MADLTADVVVDAKGLSCPMPILKAKKAMDSLVSGQMMELHATDKGAMNDVPAWAKQAGHEIMEATEEDGIFIFRVRKK